MRWRKRRTVGGVRQSILRWVEGRGRLAVRGVEHQLEEEAHGVHGGLLHRHKTFSHVHSFLQDSDQLLLSDVCQEPISITGKHELQCML